MIYSVLKCVCLFIFLTRLHHTEIRVNVLVSSFRTKEREHNVTDIQYLQRDTMKEKKEKKSTHLSTGNPRNFTHCPHRKVENLHPAKMKNIFMYR